MNISNIFKEEPTRERAINWIGLAQNIVDDYKFGVPHGVQKDALQNGWDAIAGPKTKNFIGLNWGFEFELKDLPNGVKILSMIDHGTTGLTGLMTSKDEYSADSLPQDEKWARWESLAFKKSNKNDLGARGQGKMVFIIASKDYSIFYDSLREDGTYRYGGTTATERDCKVFNFDEAEGKAKLEEHLGLDPISNKGTRVIIINPIDELVAAIESGDFLSYIEETWWPIILKYQAKITLKYNGIEKIAQVPDFFPISENAKDTDTYKTWISDNKKFKYNGQTYKIKHIHLAFDSESEKPDNYQGVACFRGGMKVPSIDFMSLQLRPHVYGYAEFENDIDEELREVEEPNHYNFQNKGIWRTLKQAIEEEMQAFGNKKLGLGVNIKESEAQKRSDAENAALMLLRMLTKGWSFKGNSNGKNSPISPIGPIETKMVGLKIHNFNFPNEGVSRLNYGEEITDFECEAFNKSPKDMKINFKLLILSGDRIIEILEEAKNVLKSGQNISYGPHSLKIIKEKFPDIGEYKLRLILTDATTKTRIDEITRKFWVEVDPPLSAPFDIQPLNFSLIPNKEDVDKLEWILEPEGDGKYKLFYNIDHPAYLNFDKETKSLSLYLSELFYQGALELMLKRVSASESGKEQEKIGPFDNKIFKTQNPIDLFREISMINSRARHMIFKS